MEITKLNNNLKQLYETDFNRWLEKTAILLKKGDLKNLNLENLIEELDSLGKNDQNALKSNLRILLMHLLKYRFQP